MELKRKLSDEHKKYQQKLKEIIKAKSENKENSTPEIEAQESTVQDLMEQLKKSLDMTG